MRKKFINTAEFLDYLDTKAYDIHYIEFEFTNGWHIKETLNAFIDFHTNSIQERDELQKKLEIDRIYRKSSLYKIFVFH